MIYESTQKGTPLIVLSAVVAGVAAAFFWLVPMEDTEGRTILRVSGLIIVGVSLLLAYLFHSLTVRVDDDGVHAALGPGFIKRSHPFSAIHKVYRERPHWFFGYGVRYVGTGAWLWRVAGVDAVTLELDGGQRFLIGADDPKALLAAIESRLRSSAPNGAPAETP